MFIKNKIEKSCRKKFETWRQICPARKPESSGKSVQVQSVAVVQPNLVQSLINITITAHRRFGNELEKFHHAWNSYEIVARIKDPENPLKKSLRTTTLLNCIDSKALDLYERLEFENEDDKKDIDIVLQKIQSYCIVRPMKLTKDSNSNLPFPKRDREIHCKFSTKTNLWNKLKYPMWGKTCSIAV